MEEGEKVLERTLHDKFVWVVGIPLHTTSRMSSNSDRMCADARD